jgi:hypothetical protein
MVALGLSTSVGGILSGCRHARLHPRQTPRQAESGRATIAGVARGCPKKKNVFVAPSWRLVVDEGCANEECVFVAPP